MDVQRPGPEWPTHVLSLPYENPCQRGSSQRTSTLIINFFRSKQDHIWNLSLVLVQVLDCYKITQLPKLLPTGRTDADFEVEFLVQYFSFTVSPYDAGHRNSKTPLPHTLHMMASCQGCIYAAFPHSFHIRAASPRLKKCKLEISVTCQLRS